MATASQRPLSCVDDMGPRQVGAVVFLVFAWSASSTLITGSTAPSGEQRDKPKAPSRTGDANLAEQGAPGENSTKVRNLKVPAPTVDLATLLAKAIERMDHGVKQFLTEESWYQYTEPEHPSRNLEDRIRLEQSQKHAMLIASKLSEDFGKLRQLADRLKAQHLETAKKHRTVADSDAHACAAKSHELEVAVQQLMTKSQRCEDVLHLRETTTLPPQTTTMRPSAPSGLSETAEQELVRLRSDNAQLHQAVLELTARLDEKQGMKYDQRMQENKLDLKVGLLLKQNQDLQADKVAMANTIQQMMKKAQLYRMSASLGAERVALRRQVNAQEAAIKRQELGLEAHEQELTEHAVEYKEVAQRLSAENVILKKNNAGLKAYVTGERSSRISLEEDKKHLLATVSSELHQEQLYAGILKRVEQAHPDIFKVKRRRRGNTKTTRNPEGDHSDSVAVMSASSAIDGWMDRRAVTQAALAPLLPPTKAPPSQPTVVEETEERPTSSRLEKAETAMISEEDEVTLATPLQGAPQALQNWLGGPSPRIAPQNLGVARAVQMSRSATRTDWHRQMERELAALDQTDVVP